MTNPDRSFDQRFVVTFQDTNVAGNVYFATYFRWQGVCRELLLALLYSQASEDLRKGMGFATKYAHMDFVHEALLFDSILIRMTAQRLTRIQVEFGFEFLKEPEGRLLAKGTQGVVWTTCDHSPGRMPNELYENIAQYFGIAT